MAADISLRAERRRPAGDDICPLESKTVRLDHRCHRESSPENWRDEERTPVSGVGMFVNMETCESSEDELGRLDIDLDRKSKQHNLTSRNVRAILHEVITHEHVVAMMKEAIRDTQDLPMFEPKMTRSRLKQVIQEGQALHWSLSAVDSTTVKPPQFVDIDLEDDEDSSDEEYCPDEDEEEDTAEEMFLSDGDSLTSPPRALKRPQIPEHLEAVTTSQRLAGLPGAQVSSTCPPQLSAPPESSFLARLNAVDEELDCSPTLTCNQSLDRKNDEGDGDVDNGSLAYRTRSKRPLVDVPLDQLEAELLPPDITDDMYEHRDEDRNWTRWLQGLMKADNEEEADDEDDPEYNFLEDLDEPDLEDYRTDRGVQITKKEVNELLDELFETLQEEEEEEKEEQEEEAATSPQMATKFNVPKAIRFEAPLASMLTEQRRAARQKYEALQQKRALQDSTNQQRTNSHLNPSSDVETVTCPPGLLLSPTCPTLYLDHTQKAQLQQQVQQHVQLLTQIHLLARRVGALSHEACITKHYLEELQQFSMRRGEDLPPSSFRACNLKGALDLVQEVEQREAPSGPPGPPAAFRRWLPTMSPATSSLAFPLLPADKAWLFATRAVFLYPELLPVCNMEAASGRPQRNVYTPGEDSLIVLGLKHFEGTVEPQQLMSSYLIRKTCWNLKKHIREMNGARAPQNNIIKTFLTQGIVPSLPLACSRVQPSDQHPPVDRDVSIMPNWLKNSQLIIQKSRRGSAPYPRSLPQGCTLRLHPQWLPKVRAPPSTHKRIFKLAHNASLLPLAKAPGYRQTDSPVPLQPVSVLPPPPQACGALPLAAVQTGPAHSVCTNTREQESGSVPLLLPLPPSASDITSPIMPVSAALTPGHFILQMVWTPPPTVLPPPAPPAPALLSVSSPPAPHMGDVKPVIEQEDCKTSSKERQEEEEESLPSTLSPAFSISEMKEEEEEERKEEEEEQACPGLVSLSGGEQTGGEKEDDRGGGDPGEAGEEDPGGGGGEGGQEREEEEEEGQKEDGGGERDEDGEKDKDEDQDQQGEEEEEEDFDDLTQDEDEEEVMSSASEESVLSVPELQETMKQLTWLAAERRLCADGDSEEDHSPTSPGSQEEEEEEEEEGAKGAESGERRRTKEGGDEDAPSGEGTPRGGGGRPGRGRGRSRPLRGLRRSRQERHSVDAAKVLQLYDQNILDNDPHRESKDVAFAQSYLSRVREALQDVPGQVGEFVSLLSEFEQAGEGQEVILLFRKLRCILGDRTDLLRDFAAFLLPEQALQCGLFQEQQAFDRSRRFLRQLEISFRDNPSHYQKIIKALQTGPDLSPTSIQELKAQMATLLKGHTHLQNEFWVFFDELRPPPAHPGQFEEAHWPEDGGSVSEGAEGLGQVVSGGGASNGFEEVTLPELEEEEEGQKIPPMTSRRQRRKMDAHRNYKDCDWSEKDWSCLCPDSKIRRHRRKGCSRCHGNKASGGVSRAMKSLNPLYSQIGSAHDQPGDKDLELKRDDDSPQPVRSSASWEGPFPLPEEKEEEEEELDDEEEDEDEEERKSSEKEQSPSVKRSRREEMQITSSVTPVSSPTSSCATVTTSLPSTSSPTITSVTTSVSPSCSPSIVPSTTSSPSSPSVCVSSNPTSSSSSAPPRPSPPPELPVCAKNISLTASGEKVILWTREADRVILTTCQQEGANQNTFQSISTLLGNKTPSEVARRFRDLMRLFRTAARHTSSEDEAPPTEPPAANEEED
ncbi:GON-4-like protein isoform X2 [Halichoeres trimaculatus]|uniref:GON-4-like protein isoform X2 n=1 Tax=Halichoeres trimaculatus TaxID=147232 RepID=UPI003D9FAB4B